jgi:8-oxo-dGTP pyrophosphatase MutT (NUDIX family)
MSFTSWLLSRGEQILLKFFSSVFFPPCSASLVAFNDEGEILVVEKGDYLMLPGGFLERDEGFGACAIREAREETGLKVSIVERIEEWNKGFAGVDVVFLGEIDSGELSGSWEGVPKFLSREEALGRKWRWDRDVESLLEKADAKR